MSNKYDIFISYRRVGGQDKARILKAALELRGYKDRIFFDHEEVKDGTFGKSIMDAIKSAPVFIFVLTPKALDRCDNTDDWVRREILYAVETERHIIPVNFDNLFKRFPKNIPDEVKNALGQHQFSQIDSAQLFEVSIDKLVRDRIVPVLARSTSATEKTEDGAIYHISTDCDCTIEKFGEKIGNAYVDGDNHICLKRGRHKLKFVSLQNPVDFVEMVIEVDSTDKEDFIEVEFFAVVKAREEAEQKASEDVERKAHEEAERKARKAHEEWLLAQDDNSFESIEKSGKFGFVVKNGNAITSLKYDYVWFFSEGLARVKLNGKYGFIDKTGKEVIPLKYDNTGYFREGLVAVELNRKLGFIDKTGKVVIPFKYDRPNYMLYSNCIVFSEGLACVNLNGKWGFIDKTGKEVIPLKYNNAGPFSEGLAAVERYKNLGFIDKTGKEVIPLKYDDVELYFREGLASVKLNGKWGYIDKTGKEVIPFKYAYAGSFENGKAEVSLKSILGVKIQSFHIDKTGKRVD